MPYIEKQFREGAQTKPIGPGELNYCFTMIIRDYIERHGMNYSVCNQVVGALECCKTEFQRRVVAPYEDMKCIKNGDVY